MNSISLCISTYNRVDDLTRLISSALMQVPKVPIIVYDDASLDATAEIVRTQFPTVRVIAGKNNVGLIAARNICIREASTPFVIILDDDAFFTSPKTVQQTLDDFSSERIGAVAVPFTENGVLMQGETAGPSIGLARSFIGAAHAVRRDAVLACGGLRESYGFYCEESDLAIRFLAAGLVVRHGSADPVTHCPNADRKPLLRRQLRWRSEFRFKYCHTPALLLLPVLGSHLALLVFRCSQFGGLAATLKLGYSTWRDVIKSRHERKGVGFRTYFLWRRLSESPRLTLGDIDDVPAVRRALEGSDSFAVQ
ncbi:glycosyltransferase family 2 protein [Arthrobacter sp. Leaf141]|uniref:glycosyltransferase family 2 protein n=1 Tax=Arthrobacter sp. Leaf141 TaxID=1736273 RepID=UPI000AF9CE36|nr:glycosyltransferase [Arthrobacter sp. Leaf141]